MTATPKEGEFTLAGTLLEQSQGLAAKWVWFVGAHARACDALGSVELHTGLVSRALVPSQSGADSYFVDDAALRAPQHAMPAMVAKCAGMGWFPTHQRSDVTELAMPGAVRPPLIAQSS